MGATLLVALRHGETAWNRERRIQGHIDIPLSATGLRQAQATALRLRDELAALAALPAALRLVSSDLTRCRQTAEPIAAALRQSLALEVGLRERAFGVLEGLTGPEARSAQPQAFDRWVARDPDADLGGGESLHAFARRVDAAFDALLAQADGATLVVVTHGGVLDRLWRRAHGLAPSAPRPVEIPNACLNRIAVQDGRWTVLSWADASHLPVALDDVG